MPLTTSPIRSPLALVLLAIAGLSAAPATAADGVKLRPGLWEIQASMKTQSGQMEAAMAELQKSMANMPAEQRKQMEQMLGNQGVGTAPGQAHTLRVCMTEQELNLQQIPTQPGCTQSVKQVGGNTLAIQFSCTGKGDEPPSSGSGTVNVQSPTRYSGQHQIKTTIDGKPEQMNMTQQARWIKADCGK